MADMEIFQEYDCPFCGVDFDLFGQNIVIGGEKFRCIGCGNLLQGGVDGPRETVLPTGDDEAPFFEFRGLPADVAQKKAWLAEAASRANSRATDVRNERQ